MAQRVKSKFFFSTSKMQQDFTIADRDVFNERNNEGFACCDVDKIF